MGQKGPVSMDSDRLSIFIVTVNDYRQKITAECDEIGALCDKMIKDETLIGGDGEAIRQSFIQMKDGYSRLAESSKMLVVALNNVLAKQAKVKDTSAGEALQNVINQKAKNVGQFHKE